MLYRRSTWEIYDGHKYTLWERTHFYDGNVDGTIKKYLCYKRFNMSVVFTLVRQRKKLLCYIPHSTFGIFPCYSFRMSYWIGMGIDDVKLCTVPYVELSDCVNKVESFLYTGILLVDG
jgi:hypothetical protein